MRLFVSGIRKLSRRPATFVTFGLLIGLLVLIVLAVGATANSNMGGGAGAGERGAAAKELLTFPGAYDRMLGFIIGLGGLFAMIYGAAIAGSEWSWGTLKSAVARGESRIRYVLLQFSSIAFMVAIGLVIAFGIAVVAAVVGAHLANFSVSGLGDTATLGHLPERLLKGWLAVVEEAALGFTIATLARSQLAGIGAGIAFYFGESFAGIFLPDVVKYMPFSVANAAVSTGSGQGLGSGAGAIPSLPADQALVLVALWLVGSLLVASIFSDRVEITG
jgi:ABC-type transport system involved in multi-copper enzyme maturation permease subunit